MPCSDHISLSPLAILVHNHWKHCQETAIRCGTKCIVPMHRIVRDRQSTRQSDIEISEEINFSRRCLHSGFSLPSNSLPWCNPVFSRWLVHPCGKLYLMGLYFYCGESDLEFGFVRMKIQCYCTNTKFIFNESMTKGSSTPE